MSDHLSRTHVDFENLRGIEFLWKELGLKGHGVSFMRLLPGDGHPFWHSHDEQEETYTILEGQATLRIDDEEVVMNRGDVVRVAAPAVRAIGNLSDAPCLILCTGSMPAADDAFKHGRALIADGRRHKELGRPDWSAAKPAPDPEVN